MDLYSECAQEFSDTRNFPWKGWEKIKHLIQPGMKILDVGCGNARFYKYIKDCINNFQYTGIDNSPEMLSIAETNIKSWNNTSELPPSVLLQLVDVEKDNITEAVQQAYDLIVVFGVMHHIRTLESRIEIVRNLYNKLTDNGALVITWWRFLDFEKYQKKIVKQEEGTLNYILKFGNNGAERFCHHFTFVEVIHTIIGPILEENWDKLDKFLADGEEDSENYYTVCYKSAGKNNQ